MSAAMVLIGAMAVAHMTPSERLNADLLAARTATSVLEQRCAALKLADPPLVRAEVIRGRLAATDPQIRKRLKVAKTAILGYRRVQLMCGPHLLSTATNWYVPERLTPEMNAALEGSDAPFGRVILPLSPYRETYATWVASGRQRLQSGVVVRHHAIVLSDSGAPLAHVVENYQQLLLRGDLAAQQ